MPISFLTRAEVLVIHADMILRDGGDRLYPHQQP
jgi:hypothetical protein